ncbi:MAG: sulfite exporter TauE/SafE family protein [Patescibacteria group bacterium]
MPRIIIWHVTGMTCKSCERLIGDELKKNSDVIETEVSLKLKQAAIQLRDDAREPDLNALNERLSAHGYRLIPEGCALPRRDDPFRTRFGRALSIILLVGFVLLLVSPLRKIIPSVSAHASIGALFLLGLDASVSTCLASTGGFLLAYSAEARSKRKTVLMHVGRLVTFVIGGALLGAIGGALPVESGTWYGAFGIVLGVGFFAVALHLLDLSPSLAEKGIALPSSCARFAEKMRQRPGGVTPFFVGAVTFILPCGFTQTAQALALASGSALRGALLLLVFALGTLPVLLGVTAFAASATFRHRAFRLVAGAVMFFFAFGQIQSGLAVFGVPLNMGAFAGMFTTPNVDAVRQGDVQIVKMDVTPYGYSPRSFTLKKGVPVRWELDAQDVAGCTNSIISRELGISRRLQVGMNVITFTPQKTGTIAFSCGMGMVRGSFHVI